ncbi:MAG TPA: hypothetical protein DD420_20990, partial [Streptomyces sp.]|nr:hypothetical protein [Streptomyces sp.]
MWPASGHRSSCSRKPGQVDDAVARAAELRSKAAADDEKAAHAELRAAQIRQEAAHKAAEAERREQETEYRTTRRIKDRQRQAEA